MNAADMRVEVRLFAILRERAGRATVELQLTDGATVADALRALEGDDALGDLLTRLPVQMAVNREYAAAETVLREGDELALIPPVSGGAPARVTVAISGEPLSLAELLDAVRDPAAGALVVFEGVTREVERLEYEAYAEMARERIELIMRECAERHDLTGAAAAHRTGSVALGEPSVIVAVSAPHREQAFTAAREAIDRIKREAPIWKREHERGEARWVPGTAPPQRQVRSRS